MENSALLVEIGLEIIQAQDERIKENNDKILELLEKQEELIIERQKIIDGILEGLSMLK